MKKITSIILIICLALSLAACGKDDSAEWVYDKETAQQLLAEYEKIAAIPRDTGHCEAIGEYIKESLKALGLDPLTDSAGNIIAEIPATEGLEKLPLTILQSNMDMVCAPQPINGVASEISYQSGDASGDGAAVGESSADTTSAGISVVIGDDSDDESEESESYDPLTDPIVTIYDDGHLSADGTALGADSGMAIAILLKYLSEENAKHGPLRLIFTADANDAFAGANSLDSKFISDAPYLINLCSKSSKYVYCGSAGQREIEISKTDIASEDIKYNTGLAVRVFGLVGGDAADAVDRGRLNAGDILIGMLKDISDKGIDYQLLHLYGGTGSASVIADATAIIRIDDDDFDPVWACIEEKIDSFEDEYANTEPGLECTVTGAADKLPAIADADLKNFLDYASAALNGEISETASVNMGVFSITAEGMHMKHMLYSTDTAELSSKTEEFLAFANEKGFAAEVTDVAEVWALEKENSLTKQISKAYQKLTGEEIKTRQCSSGLECSCFKIKNSSLQLLSIGPDVWDCGTTEEFCNVESAVKILNLLESFLPEIN